LDRLNQREREREGSREVERREGWVFEVVVEKQARCKTV
jgi:hypothetical protein